MFWEEVFVSIIGLFVCANKIVSQRFPEKVVGKQKQIPSYFPLLFHFIELSQPLSFYFGFGRLTWAAEVAVWQHTYPVM